MNWLLFLLIGLAAGWLAGRITKGKGFGLIGNLIVGCVGAVLGGWLLALFGIRTYGLFGSLIAALVGALVLLWIVSIIRKK